MQYSSLRSVAAASLLALGLACSAHAGVVTTWTVDSVVNGVAPSLGNTSLNTGAKATGVQINVGDVVVISTGADDRWNINGWQVTAAGFPNGYFNKVPPTPNSHNHANLPDLNELTAIDYGALAYSLNGLDWSAAYDDATLATTVTFTATSAGTLLLAMYDSVVSDNGTGTIGSESNILTVTVDVTPGARNDVPEPPMVALVGLALGALAFSRRRQKAA